MKRNLLLAFSAFVILISACKKDAPDFTGYDPTGVIDQPGNQFNESYLPSSKGTYWKYQVTTGAKIDTNVITLTGEKTTMNGRTYLNIVGKANNMPEQPGYYYAGDHIYTLTATSAGGYTLEFLYLNDTTKIGNTWIGKLTPTGTVNGVPARLTGKMIEKNITKVVLGKTFTNVTHTELNIEYDFLDGSGFKSYGKYDYYIAKGVGMIQIDSEVYGGITSSQKIFDYGIK